MSLISDIGRSISAVHVTPRFAVLLALPALPIMFLPAPWSWSAAAVWIAACAGAAWADLRAAVRLSELEWERETPPKLSIGVPNPVRLRVRNASARVARIVARETPPPGFAGERAFGAAEIGPRAVEERTLQFTPPSRGTFRFGEVGVLSFGPRRLAAWRGDAPTARDVRVYPDIQAVKQYALLARRGLLHEIGVRAARYAGAGTEFESLRDWQPGDDYRDVDWKATARRGRPVVRRYEVERSQTIVLAVDAGRLMTPVTGVLTKLDRAVNAALLMAYLATHMGDQVGLLVFARDVRTYLPPRRGHRQFLAILEALHGVEGKLEEPDYAGAMRYLAARVQRRALVVVFTDLAGEQASHRLLRTLAALAPRHLPLVVTQRNRDVEARATAEPTSESKAFAAAVAEDLLRDKAAAVRTLQARGALVLDVHPEEISVASVNRYLEIKARGRL